MMIGVLVSLQTSLFGAAIELRMTDPIGDPHSTIAQPGDSFDVLVLLDATESAVSGEFAVRDYAASGIFTLNSVVFESATWDTGIILDPTMQTLNAGNGYTSGTFGSIANDLVVGTGTGTFGFATINISVDAAATDGSYPLNLVDLVFGDLNFNTIQSVASGQNYIVHVPEPGTLLVLMLGAGAFVMRRRRNVHRRHVAGVLIALIAAFVTMGAPTRVDADHGGPQEVPMQPGTLTVCDGIFKDSGGYGDSYESGENWTLTFFPNDPASEKVRLVFGEFDTDPQFTAMDIYDGNSTASPFVGRFAGNNSPGQIISTAPDGSLTIKWFSGETGFPDRTGWQARLTCVPARRVSFQSSGQSMWGPGPNATIPDSQRVEFLTFNYEDFRPGRNIVNVLGSQFGTDAFAGITGDVGIMLRFEDIGPGSVGVNYPVEVTLASPSQDDFRPGQWVTIDSKYRIRTEASPSISAISPQVGVDLDGRANLSAQASVTGCVFSCESFNLFPPINLSGIATIVGVEPGGNQVEVITQSIPGVSTPFDIPLPITALTGIGGRIDTPNLSLPAGPAATQIVGGNSLVASGTDEFMTLSMDIDKWILKALGAPPGLQLEIPEIPIFTILGRWTIFGSFLIMDLDVDTDFHEDFTYSFTPTVRVSLDFAQPVRYKVRRGATVLQDTTGSVITFDAGDSVDFVAPDAVLDVTPVISLHNPRFRTQTSTRFVRSFREKLMELGIRVPAQEVGCFPSVGPCRFCTPSFCVNSPELNLHVGPAVNLDEPFGSFSDARLFQRAIHEFNLQGLTPAMASTPFSVDPEFKPVPVIDGPTAPFLEGDTVTFSGARSTDADGDALTYAWNFGGEGVGPTTVGPEVSFTYGDDGVFNVVLTVDDGHGFPVSAVHTVTVLNVPANVLTPADPILDFDEGSFAAIPTLATDPGFLDRHLSSADFGDGSEGWSFFSYANNGPITQMGHVYADDGEYTVNYCVEDDEGEGGCESTIARIHNVAPIVTELHELTTRVPAGGQTFEADLRLFASFNDPGTLDTHTARLEWGDSAMEVVPVMEAPFGPPGSGAGADGLASNETQHVYTTRGDYDVRVCVQDDDGAETCIAVETIHVPESDLAISMAVTPESSVPVPVGNTIAYTLSITNNGPDAAPDVLARDVLPAGLELVSAMRSTDGQIETKLSLDDPEDEDFFGTSMGLDGDTLVIGAIRASSGVGEATVFRADGAGWANEATLIASDAVPFFLTQFGQSLDIDGDTVIVGAALARNGADEVTGAAYVFRRNGTTWTEEAKLLADDGALGDDFGTSVAIHGDKAIVGAPAHNGGAVYLFERSGSTWTQTDKFTNGTDGEFGASVAMSSDAIAIASPGSPFASSGRPGSVMVLRHANGTWAVEDTIVEADLTDFPDANTFASAITMAGDTLMASTRYLFSNTAATRVLVFERDGANWAQQSTIVADATTLNDRFGESLNFDGRTLGVGAPRSGNAGATYVFRRSGNSWSQDAKLTPAGVDNNSTVGQSVSVAGDFIAFGAPQDRALNQGGVSVNAGAAYVVAVCAESPAGTINCGMGDIASGETATVEIVARVGCVLAGDPFVSTQLTNTASVSAQALDFTQADNATSITSTTALPLQGICGADFTPPVVSPVVTGTLGDNDFYTSDVMVSWQVSDSDSPISNESGCAMTSISSDTQGVTITCSATSGGGTTTNSVTIKRDTTPPVLTATLNGTAGNNGWHRSDVEVSFSCTDATSGAANCPAPTLLTNEGINSCVFASATDRAGNTGSITVDGIKIDKTPPVLSASRTPANANGWNNADVTVSFACADNVSGMATCPATEIVTTEGANQIVLGIANDLAGNEASLSMTGINIDRTPPTITANALPAANAAGWRNSIVEVSFDCSDALSGIVECPPATSLATEGLVQSASGTVLDLAGNSASATAADINIDWTPPSITAVTSASPDAFGMYDPGLTVSYVCSDALSGVETCPTDDTFIDFGLDQDADGTAMDMAGNTAGATVVGIDVGRPVITPAAGLSTDEGFLIDAVLANVSSSAATTGSATIDWGDASSPDTFDLFLHGTGEVRGNHVYADNGEYTVEICVVDLLGRQICESLPMTIGNQPPILQGVEVPAIDVVLNTNAQILATFNDLGTADTHIATIDWGDGTELEAVEVIEGVFGPPGDVAGLDGSIQGNHTYTFPGEYQGQLCVMDDEGEIDCRPFTLVVAPLREITCSIEVGTMSCSGPIVTIPLAATVRNVGDEPINFLWEADNPGGTYTDMENSDFDDPQSRTPTLTTNASEGFNVFCTAIFSTESGLDPVTCQAFVTPCVQGAVNSWFSVRTHGNAGELSIPLDASKADADTGTNGPTSEPRLGGIQKIVVMFDYEVEAADGAIGTDDVVVTDSGSQTYVPMGVSLDAGESGTMLEILFDADALPNEARLTFELAGTFRSVAGGELIAGDTDCQIVTLVGDSNNDNQTDSSDLSEVLAQSGRSPATTTNARQDINADGLLNLIDVALTRQHLGGSLPLTAPEELFETRRLKMKSATPRIGG